MKIVCDDKIPFLRGVLEPVGEIIYLPGAKITAFDVKDADALIVRTRTLCNEPLLAKSSVQFIGTATIGFDHLDRDYLEHAGIAWSSAPGCNAPSVAQYVTSALFVIAEKMKCTPRQLTLGVVGVGNVGKRVAAVARTLGMKVLLNDPPRVRNEATHADQFVNLSQIYDQADIISFHVPLNREGIDCTYHLGDQGFFASLVRHPWIINTSRGEVIETAAIKKALKKGQISGAVLDVWEQEPLIDSELLASASIGTPHIAGYSMDGKAAATTMIVQALSRFFNLGFDDWRPHELPLPATTQFTLTAAGKTATELVAEAVRISYDILGDDRRLRAHPLAFEKLREEYPLRREAPCYQLTLRDGPEEVRLLLADLGFRIDPHGDLSKS